jgi:hypothetical protein
MMMRTAFAPMQVIQPARYTTPRPMSLRSGAEDDIPFYQTQKMKQAPAYRGTNANTSAIERLTSQALGVLSSFDICAMMDSAMDAITAAQTEETRRTLSNNKVELQRVLNALEQIKGTNNKELEKLKGELQNRAKELDNALAQIQSDEKKELKKIGTDHNEVTQVNNQKHEQITQTNNQNHERIMQENQNNHSKEMEEMANTFKKAMAHLKTEADVMALTSETLDRRSKLLENLVEKEQFDHIDKVMDSFDKSFERLFEKALDAVKKAAKKIDLNG